MLSMVSVVVAINGRPLWSLSSMRMRLLPNNVNPNSKKYVAARNSNLTVTSN